MNIDRLVELLVYVLVVVLIGWFVLEVVDRLDDDANPGLIDLPGYITGRL